MILIIGGAGQGKLDYVLQKTGYGPAQVARTPEEARTRPVFAGLEDWPELDEAALLDKADYISEMRCVRHPYDTKGVGARKGIEY